MRLFVSSSARVLGDVTVHIPIEFRSSFESNFLTRRLLVKRCGAVGLGQESVSFSVPYNPKSVSPRTSRIPSCSFTMRQEKSSASARYSPRRYTLRRRSKFPFTCHVMSFISSRRPPTSNKITRGLSIAVLLLIVCMQNPPQLSPLSLQHSGLMVPRSSMRRCMCQRQDSGVPKYHSFGFGLSATGCIYLQVMRLRPLPLAQARERRRRTRTRSKIGACRMSAVPGTKCRELKVVR